MVAEDVLDRLRLGGVAERGRGAVGVDVADALGLDARALERRAHHRRDAGRLRLGLRQVVRVVRGAVAEHLGVDRRRRAARRAPSPRAASAPAPSAITKPARVASNGREARGGCSSSAARPRIAVKPARISGIDARLGAAREHRVGVAALDHLGRLADRVRAGRAGRDDRVVRALDPERDRELARDACRRGRSAGSSATRGPGRARAGSPPARRSRARRRSPSRRRSRRASGSKPLSPASASASRPAADAEQDVPLELARLLRPTRRWVGSKPLTSAAIRTGSPSVSKARIQSIPLSPAARRARCAGASRPSGVTRADAGDRDARHRGELNRTLRPDAGCRASRSRRWRRELVRELPDGDGWQYEPKWDGFRGVLENVGRRARALVAERAAAAALLPGAAAARRAAAAALGARRRDRDRARRRARLRRDADAAASGRVADPEAVGRDPGRVRRRSTCCSGTASRCGSGRSRSGAAELERASRASGSRPRRATLDEARGVARPVRGARARRRGREAARRCRTCPARATASSR